jgi:two-component system, LuxR family, sensor kinase FixL
VIAWNLRVGRSKTPSTLGAGIAKGSSFWRAIKRGWPARLVRAAGSSSPKHDANARTRGVIDFAGLIDSASTDAWPDPRRSHGERVAEIGDMAAALAHEVDQPLTAILSNAQAAQRFLAHGEPDIDELRELLAEIVDDSTRAHTIVRKMRRFATSKSTEHKRVDMNGIVRDVVQRLHREADACSTSVAVHVAARLPLVDGDATQLQQVLVNLLMNAFDALRECPARERSIDVSTAARDDPPRVHVEVCDSGPGISATRVGELFKPFATTKPNGLGLGLSISRTLVIAHGGRLWAEPNHGRGMTFHIELPASGVGMRGRGGLDG